MNSQVFKPSSVTSRDKGSFILHGHNMLSLLLQYVSFLSAEEPVKNIENTRSCIIWIELFIQLFIPLSLRRQVHRPFQSQHSTKNDRVLQLQFAASQCNVTHQVGRVRPVPRIVLRTGTKQPTAWEHRASFYLVLEARILQVR